VLAAGCAAAPPHREGPVAPPAPSGATTIDQHFEAISQDAKRSEHEREATARSALADDAGREAEACLAGDPKAAACLYGHAIALGLDARAHPARAGQSLKQMLAELDAAEAADPAYDQAGPARVRALVLTRAPGWPLGPGDPAAGVDAARRAVSLKPEYPPNLLALAEALTKSADSAGAHAAYQRAHDAALGSPPSADRDEWLSEADRGLQRQ
jgi:hypothetical protein